MCVRIFAALGVIMIIVGFAAMIAELVVAGLLLLWAARRLYAHTPTHEVQHQTARPVRIRVIITIEEDKP
jgi:hypothetical protein